MHRIAIAFAVGSAVIGVSSTSWAADSAAQQCVQAAEKGQELKDASKLLEAKDSFRKCQLDVCPKVVAQKCEIWAAEIDEITPTISVRATLNGQDITDVKVFVDGNLVRNTLDGSDIPLNPGIHKFRIEKEGKAPIEQSRLVHVREKAKTIEANFDPPKAAPPPGQVPPPYKVAKPKEGFHVPTSTWVSAGVGLASVGVGSFFLLSAKSRYDDLQNGCGKNGSCEPSDVSGLSTKWTLGQVFMGVGVISLGAATYFLISGNTGQGSSDAGAQEATLPSKHRWDFGLAPSKDGMVGAVHGTF